MHTPVRSARTSTRARPVRLTPRGSRAAFLAALASLAGPVALGEVLFSTGFNAYTNTGTDAVKVNGGADTAISITGGGSNLASPSGYWNVADSSAVDLAGRPYLDIPAVLTGGSAFTYGDTSVGNSQFKRGAVFTTRGNFTHLDGTLNAQIRYATGTSPNRGYVQLNAAGLHDVRFNVPFEIKAGAAPRAGWELSFRYGTGGTSVDTWNSNTAAQNGSATAQIYSVDPATGLVATSPAVSFSSVNLSGAGPVAALSALDAGAALGPGHYLLSIRLHGKTSSQRYTLDDLSVSAASGPAEVILDNNASSGVTLVGSWTTATSAPGYYGANYLHDGASGKGSKSVTYAPNLAAGVYAVSVRHPAASNHAAAVPVDVSHAQGADYVTLDQRSGGGEWLLLGNYRFAAGNSGYVRISNAGTTGLVVADAVRFTPIGEPSDVEVLADGLIDWRTPDGDGITCAQCHGPGGYDVAVFSFTQADLRRATAPHLDDAAADRIFKMIELHRRNYPPAGGLKDVTAFRPFQPTGVVLGGANATQEQRDAAFGNHVAANFLYAQGRIDTLAQARAVRDQLVALDIDSVPIGIAFNRWSESVSRQGAQDGGKIAEWLPGIGFQVLGANAAAFEALEDAYVANPTDANFWNLFHKIDAWTTPDPHNSGPVTDINWIRLHREQLKSNLVFQHDELLKSQGVHDWVTGRTSVRPFQDQEGQGSKLAFFWDVADAARIVKSTSFAQLPVRHQQSLWLGSPELISTQVNRLRNTWFYLGWTVDHSLFFTGPSNATRSGEYFIEQLWTENLRAHQVFFNLTHVIKRGFQPGGWAGGNHGGPVQHFNSQKPYYLAYNKYKKGTDAPGYPGSADAYKLQLANSVRVMALLHDQDIKDKGGVYTVGSGGKTTILSHVENMRAVLDWADPANKTQNDAILDALIATVNAYPLY
jgi:hypothetical protein